MDLQNRNAMKTKQKKPTKNTHKKYEDDFLEGKVRYWMLFPLLDDRMVSHELGKDAAHGNNSSLSRDLRKEDCVACKTSLV